MNFNTNFYKISKSVIRKNYKVNIGDICNNLTVTSTPYLLESIKTGEMVLFVDCLCICGKHTACNIRNIKNDVQISCGCKLWHKGTKGSRLLNDVKRCSSCLLELSGDRFYNSKSRLDGKKPYCKNCQYISRIKYKFNIDLSYLLNSYILCEICNKQLFFPNESDKNHETLCVDHNHQTNEYRGILCSNCNCALGSMQDNKEIMKSMIEYIKKTNSKP